MERGQRHNARAGATVAAAKAAGAPPSPDPDGTDGEALTGQPRPGRGARIYRAAKAGVATAAAPEAVAAKAAASAARRTAAGGGAGAAARPGATPPAAPAGGSPPTAPGGRSGGGVLARAAGKAAAAVVPPSVARAAGYAAGLAGGSGAVTATKDRLRNSKFPKHPVPADERHVEDTLSDEPANPSAAASELPAAGTGAAEPGSDPAPGRSG
ncbi:MAG TPA: hypothetical protein VM243_18890, partial [Phycisphaerae bacterium]|nr:hypothetical protein [Phycisphaerae bacterium]